MTLDDIRAAAKEGAREAVDERFAALDKRVDTNEGRINSLEATRDNIRGGARVVAWIVGALAGVGALWQAISSAKGGHT